MTTYDTVMTKRGQALATVSATRMHSLSRMIQEAADDIDARIVSVSISTISGLSTTFYTALVVLEK